jgi:hypothetical protein
VEGTSSQLQENVVAQTAAVNPLILVFSETVMSKISWIVEPLSPGVLRNPYVLLAQYDAARTIQSYYTSVLYAGVMFMMVALIVWKSDLVTRLSSAGMVLWRPKMQRRYTAVTTVRFNVLVCLRTTLSALPTPSQADV